jgi:hypothetical protein
MREILQTKIELPSFLRSYIAKLAADSCSFFKKPFSLRGALILGFLFGLASPYLLWFLDTARFFSWRYDYAKIPWMPLLIVAATAAFLQWRSERANFQWRLKFFAGAGLAVFLFSMSLLVSYWVCFMQHICMDGHMAHGPYPTMAYVCDGAWAAGLIVASISFARCRFPFASVFAIVAGFMISMRFVFGSFGGVYPYF